MPLDDKKIIIGAPDQSATAGAWAYAPTSTTLPTEAGATLGSEWTDGGYVSEDGVSVTPTYNTTNIKDWSKATVRTVLNEFTGEVAYTIIQTDEASLKAVFGAENVVKVAATTSHGEQLTVKMGARMAPSKAYCFSIKDGDARARIVLPNAQPVVNGSLTFAADSPISWPVTLKCSANADGDSIIILTDDGVVSA